MKTVCVWLIFIAAVISFNEGVARPHSKHRTYLGGWDVRHGRRQGFEYRDLMNGVRHGARFSPKDIEHGVVSFDDPSNSAEDGSGYIINPFLDEALGDYFDFQNDGENDEMLTRGRRSIRHWFGRHHGHRHGGRQGQSRVGHALGHVRDFVDHVGGEVRKGIRQFGDKLRNHLDSSSEEVRGSSSEEAGNERIEPETLGPEPEPTRSSPLPGTSAAEGPATAEMSTAFPESLPTTNPPVLVESSGDFPESVINLS